MSYVSRSDVDKILIEATANENWNIANTKLQTLADAAYQKYLFPCSKYSDNYQTIVAHLKQKLEVPAYEWRRILKSLTAMEYILKNGPPRFAQDLKMDLFRLQNMQSFSYYEDG